MQSASVACIICLTPDELTGLLVLVPATSFAHSPTGFSVAEYVTVAVDVLLQVAAEANWTTPAATNAEKTDLICFCANLCLGLLIL